MTVPRHIETDKDYHRATGRGGPQEEDVPQGAPLLSLNRCHRRSVGGDASE